MTQLYSFNIVVYYDKNKDAVQGPTFEHQTWEEVISLEFLPMQEPDAIGFLVKIQKEGVR